MKKYFKLLIFIALFFIKIDDVEARFYGSYRYDVDSVTLSNTNFIIKGWAAINNASDEPFNNISPTYTLIVNACTVDGCAAPGGKLTSFSVSDLKSNPGLLDYSRNWSDNVEGANYYKYYNINYKFTVTLAQLQAAVLDRPTFDHFEMILRVTTGGVTKNINLAFQTVVVTGTSTDISFTGDVLTQVVNVAADARTQLTSTIGGSKLCYNRSTNVYSSTGSAVCNPIPNTVFMKINGIYDVVGRTTSSLRKPLSADLTSPLVRINSYKINGHVDYDRLYKYTLGGITYNTHYLINGNSGAIRTYYEPSSWTKPPEDTKVYIRITPPVIPEPVCTDDPTKSDPMSCYCSTHPEDISTCGDVEGPNINNDNNSGSCSIKTTYELQEPKAGYGKTTLDFNSACKISCQEDMIVSFETGQLLKAGTGFTYPVTMNGVRYCVAQYENTNWSNSMNSAVANAKTAFTNMVARLDEAKNIDATCGTKNGFFCMNSGADWATEQTKIGAKINAATTELTNYTNNLNSINGLNNARSTCDNYNVQNPYNGSSSNITTTNVPNQTGYSVTVDTSTSNDVGRYNTVNKNISICTISAYASPVLVGDYKAQASAFSGNYCQGSSIVTKTYNDFAVNKFTSDKTFEFSQDYYVQKYTGELSITKINEGYVYDGHKAYTSFYDMSGTYPFSLNVANYGPNLPGIGAGFRWNIIPYDCSYEVINKIFPQKGDPQYDLYGSVGFTFRQVSLLDMFPNRKPRENWEAANDLITNIQTKGYSIYGNTPLYTLYLTPATMQNIRTDAMFKDKVYGFSDPNDPANSKLIEKYSAYIVKGSR